MDKYNKLYEKIKAAQPWKFIDIYAHHMETPVTLADVMYCLSKNLEEYDGCIVDVFGYFTYRNDNSNEDREIRWDLTKPLENQSDELKGWLMEVLL